jgi:drug/metabolite transporter (DMT)-like permease
MAAGHNAKFGPVELTIFLLALITGTSCTLTSKALLDMKGIGMTGEVENFSFPLFQTFGMFFAMLIALVMHASVLTFKIPFPGYIHRKERDAFDEDATPWWMYFVLAAPAMFDLCATALAMYGMLYIGVSIYQMLRGGAIVFVALLKHYMLKDKLKKFMWVGVGWNVVSIVLVGATAIFSPPDGSGMTPGYAPNPALGVSLVLAGAFVQSLQYAFEEKVMSMEISAPPLLLVGMEGFWGALICIFVLYPLAYYTPGSDHGSFENPFNTYYMVTNSSEISWMVILYLTSITSFNIFCVLITFMLNSVWHAILDNFRPVTVWGSSLFIFYYVQPNFGESWTIWSWVQLMGLFVLLYGTAVYNAPNPGSIKLEGDAKSCFIDCTDEYQELEAMQEENTAEAKHLESSTDVAVLEEVTATHMTTMSPFMRPKRTPSMRERTPVIGKQRSPFRDGAAGGYTAAQYGSVAKVEMESLKKPGSFA